MTNTLDKIIINNRKLELNLYRIKKLKREISKDRDCLNKKKKKLKRFKIQQKRITSKQEQLNK